MNLTTTGTPEAEREARTALAYCAICLDFVLYSAYVEWRNRFYTDNPFRN